MSVCVILHSVYIMIDRRSYTRNTKRQAFYIKKIVHSHPRPGTYLHTREMQGNKEKKEEEKKESRWNRFKASLPSINRYTIRDAALFVVSAAVIVKFGDLVAV